MWGKYFPHIGRSQKQPTKPSNITTLHYYIITKCLFLTIVYNNIFIYKYIIILYYYIII